MSGVTLTPWFLGSVKPVRAGVYETESIMMRTSLIYRYWTGRHWCMGATSPAGAWLLRGSKAVNQHHAWRGLLVQEGGK